MVEILELLTGTLVSWLFGIILISSIVYIIKLHLSNGSYKNFRLSQLICRADGTLDRKAFKDVLLFFVSLYGFIFVMHKHSDMIISYFWAMAGIWLGAHVLDNKLPTLGGRPSSPVTPPHDEHKGPTT